MVFFAIDGKKLHMDACKEWSLCCKTKIVFLISSAEVLHNIVFSEISGHWDLFQKMWDLTYNIIVFFFFY